MPHNLVNKNPVNPEILLNNKAKLNHLALLIKFSFLIDFCNEYTFPNPCRHVQKG
jgi:hypothetical protein